MLQPLTSRQLVDTCARFRPGDLADPREATRHALRPIARRWTALHGEIADPDSQPRTRVVAEAPALLTLPGVGAQVTASLLAERSSAA